jgi:DNA modification methylase
MPGNPTMTDLENSSERGPLEFTGDISPDFTIPDEAEIMIISRDQSFLTHGIHKFPAKFFPELPRYLIRRYSKPGELVLDPMCGSGTVVLEAMLHERQALGVDIDPLAFLITKVKTTPIPSDELDEAHNSLLSKLEDLLTSPDYTPSIPDFHYRSSWFREFVLKELGLIQASISQLGTSDDIRDLLRVVFSSIIRESSNADPHCTRTVIRKKVSKDIHPGDTLEAFRNSLGRQIVALHQLWVISKEREMLPPKLLQTCAKELPFDDSSIDLAVTSPPYVNAVDYPRTHQLELYWLGLLQDGELSTMKRKYIGTETVYKEEYKELQQIGVKSLDSTVKSIYVKDPRRAFIVFKFFEDMVQHLQEVKRVLKPDGRYCLAIGNNLIRGVPVRSHRILADLAVERVGFEMERQFFSGLIRHFIKIPRPERMNGEWVLVLTNEQQ